MPPLGNHPAEDYEPQSGELGVARRTQLLHDAAVALLPGERVLDIGTGTIRRSGTISTTKGSIVVTDRRVFLFSKKLGGHDSQDFSYEHLSSVDYRKGLIYGDVDLALAGDHTKVTQLGKLDAERIARLIRERVSSAQDRRVGAGTTGSVADEVRKLATLRDDGLLTTEEFDREKNRLLGGGS